MIRYSVNALGNCCNRVPSAKKISSSLLYTKPGLPKRWVSTAHKNNQLSPEIMATKNSSSPKTTRFTSEMCVLVVSSYFAQLKLKKVS